MNIIRFNKTNRSMCSSVALTAALFASIGTASAQTVVPAAAPADAVVEPEQTGEITVTARRKSENILRTPISIKALTSEDIAAKGIATIQDIAQSTPGMNIQQTATQGARADRSFTSVQLRGFVPSTSAAQTTSIFIDGAPISVATGIQSLTNPERVEVIKGPQSALFGRQTFAGAINVVTKAPSDHLTGSVMLSGGTRSNYDVQAEVSAPIIEDVLSFRASVRGFGKHGSYRNQFGSHETLGDQSTKTGSLAVVFKPTSNLTFKAFGLFSELDDGPPLQGLISSRADPSGQGLFTDQHNCTIVGRNGVAQPFFCGVAPAISSVAPSANTGTTPTISNFLNLNNGDPFTTVAGVATKAGRILSPSQGVKGYGLVNHFRHYHLNADWALGESGVTLSSLTAWNSELKSELHDVDNYYSSTVNVGGARQPEGYYNFPFMIEGRSRDFSQEVRASFENGGPLHASGGGSYLIQRNIADSGSPITSLSFSGAAQSKTYGAFGSLSYDFGTHFTLSADARYQIDKIYAFAGQGGVRNTAAAIAGGAPLIQIAEGDLIVSKVYKNFLPRVIGQYNIDSRNMVYASYSKGVNPGQFNTTFITSPEPQVRAAAAANGFSVIVNPEKITNYEIGAKGRLFNILHYDVAAYIAIWSDQIQSQSIILTADGGGAAAAGTPIQAVAASNSGSLKVSGLEANLGVDVAKGLTIDLAGAYTKSFIFSATNVAVTSFYNITNFRGKENPFVSKWTANASVSYTTPIKDDVDFFGRADFTYKSGAYTDISNTSWGPDQTQVNVRLGARNKTLSFEGYVTNLFNNKGYYNVGSSGLNVYNLALNGAQYSSLVAALRDLRTFGVRASFNF